MKKDLVSIIVPVYNTEKYLEECLVALKNQTYNNIEVILVDDGSTDNSVEICDIFCKDDNRFKVFHRKNHGASATRNFGIEKTTGKYIMFCDSDDTYDLNMVSTMVETIKKHNTDIARCTFNSNTHIEDISDLDDKKFNSHDIDILSRFVTNRKHLTGFTVLFIVKKDYIVKLHDKITYMEDLHFVTKLLLNANSVSFVNKKLYTYRPNPTSITRNSSKAISNISSGLLCFSELKKMINDNKLLTKDFEKEMNSMLCLLLYSKLVLIDRKIYKDNKNEILTIINSEDFISAFSNSDKKEMSFILIIVRWLIIHKQFNMMFRIIWFKNSIKSILNK